MKHPLRALLCKHNKADKLRISGAQWLLLLLCALPVTGTRFLLRVVLLRRASLFVRPSSAAFRADRTLTELLLRSITHSVSQACRDTSKAEWICFKEKLMELTLLDYSMVHHRPSEIAAASLCLSQLLLDGLTWSPTQQHYSTYDEPHLKPIMQHIAKNVVTVNEGKTKFQAVKNKYSSSKLLKISLIPQLKSSIIKNMAAPLLNP